MLFINQNSKESSKRKFITAGIFATCFVIMLVSAFKPTKKSDEVPYPEGYRDWFHVKSVVIEKGNPAYQHWGGIHHIYANAKARQGYRSGSFGDGSVIVFDVLSVVHTDSLIVESKRKIIDVMVRDTKRFDNTGGWGYEEFNGDSKTERNVNMLNATQCYSCHAKKVTNDNVFSKITE